MYLRNFVKSSGWLLISSIFSRFANIFTLAMLARILGPENLGSFNLMQQTIVTTENLSLLGVDAAIHTNGAKFETYGRKYTGRLFGTGGLLIIISALLISISLWFFRFNFASNIFSEERIDSWMIVICFVVFFTSSSNPPWLYLQALNRFKLFSIRSSLLSFLNLIVIISLSYFFGLGGALCGLLIVSLFNLIVSIALAYNVLRASDIRLKFDKIMSQSKSILKFGLPFYSTNFLGGVITLPLLFYLGASTGIENIAYIRTSETFSQMISFIPIALSPAIITYLSALTKKDKQQFLILRSLHFRVITTIVFFICFLGLVSVNFLLPILFGQGFTKAVILSKLTLISSFFSSISAILSQYLISEGKTRVIGLTSFITTLLFLASALVLIPSFGSFGFLFSKAIIPLFSFLIFSSLLSRNMFNQDLKQSKYLIFIMIVSIIFNFLLSTIFKYNYSFLSLFSNCIILFSSLFLIYKFIFTSQEKKEIFLLINQKLRSIKSSSN